MSVANKYNNLGRERNNCTISISRSVIPNTQRAAPGGGGSGAPTGVAHRGNLKNGGAGFESSHT